MSLNPQLLTNIKTTIRAMKRRGTVGCSYGCLRQNTCSRGLTITVAEYNQTFNAAADVAAAACKFRVYHPENY